MTLSSDDLAALMRKFRVSDEELKHYPTALEQSCMSPEVEMDATDREFGIESSHLMQTYYGTTTASRKRLATLLQVTSLKSPRECLTSVELTKKRSANKKLQQHQKTASRNLPRCTLVIDNPKMSLQKAKRSISKNEVKPKRHFWPSSKRITTPQHRSTLVSNSKSSISTSFENKMSEENPIAFPKRIQRPSSAAPISLPSTAIQRPRSAHYTHSTFIPSAAVLPKAETSLINQKQLLMLLNQSKPMLCNNPKISLPLATAFDGKSSLLPPRHKRKELMNNIKRFE